MRYWALTLFTLLLGSCSDPAGQSLGGDSTCGPGRTDCGGVCVDLSTDAENCGACAQACREGQVCSLGQCEDRCGPGLVDCDGACRDPSNDPLSCGGCGVTCSDDERCVGGRCELFCPSSFEACDGVCRDTTRDPEHCGGCSLACAPGEACRDSACTLSCPSGQSVCEGQCFDLERSFIHCGECGNGCAQGATCRGGACECPGALGLACEGDCVDAAVDLDNCGACGAACAVYCIDADCVVPEEFESDGAFILARMSDGTVRGWGQNFNSQLGTGDARNRSRPTRVGAGIGLGGIVDIAGSGTHGCAVDTRQEVWCWGGNNVSQLGIPATLEPRRDPVNNGFDRVVAVETGGAHTCTIRDDGTVWCWGAGNTGALGDGTQVRAAASPVQAQGLSDVVDLGLGSAHSCAVDRGGAVYCWGQNASRQVGGQAEFAVLVPVEVRNLDPNDRVVDVSAGGNHTCALYESGKVQCWGRGFEGQLGTGDSLALALVPLDVARFSDFVQVDVGSAHACGLRRNGRVACWGANDSGQIGDGTMINALEPTEVSGLPASIVEVEATFATSCARSSDGTTACWGQGVFGQIGDGNNSNAAAPVIVAW